jgi:predicted kinase
MMAGMMEGAVIPAGLIVLIGPPGAGKSTFADEFVRRGAVEPGAVISSDAIATELFGGHHPDDDGVIFGERDRRILARLQRGQVAIADSTNVRPEARQRLIGLARKAKVPASALRFSMSLQTLRAQDAAREKHVADIDRYHELMLRTCTPADLRVEGFAYVFDVPGAEAGLSVQDAARAFSVAGAGAREATSLEWGEVPPWTSSTLASAARSSICCWAMCRRRSRVGEQSTAPARVARSMS